MTRAAGDPVGSGLITVQIFVFRGNPLKYTDPDGRVDQNYLKKGFSKIAEGKAQITFGKWLLRAGYASIFANPAAPAVIDDAQVRIREGEDLIDTGNAIINNAWTSDAIGKGHAYKNHVQKRNEFDTLGLSGDGSQEDKDKFVSIINESLENPTAHKPNRASGNEMYLDEKNGIIILVDPKSPDKGTVFRPERDTRNPQTARSYYETH
jgi:hypothetical protein